MSYEIYKILHMVGMFLVFLGLGGMLLGSRDIYASPRSSATVLHHVGLLVMVVAGFGMLARLSISWPWPGWVLAKVGAWVLIGALPALYKRKLVPATFVWIIAVAIGAAAAWLAIRKPF